MKKLIKITTLAMLIVMLFSITACSQSGKIESVNDHYSVYRYKVKEVQLIDKNASDGGIEVLQPLKTLSTIIQITNMKFTQPIQSTETAIYNITSPIFTSFLRTIKAK